jgi:hypothetical protein
VAGLFPVSEGRDISAWQHAAVVEWDRAISVLLFSEFLIPEAAARVDYFNSWRKAINK